MEKFTVREVVEQAVQTERLGNQFYTAMAERFSDGQEEIHKLFTTLAAKELTHEKTFGELREIIGDAEPEGWDEASQYLRAIVESEFFLGAGKSLPSMERIQSAEDAVNFALGFEKETLLYFYEVMKLVKEKEIVEEIVNEEKSHIMWLSAFRSSLIKKK
ncbi:MAG: ferritin family protein [Thermodesulfovibrionales bacterium]|jgi:rubrerythrin